LIFSVKLQASAFYRILDDLAGGLQVLALFELHLALDFLAFDIRDEEGLNKIADVSLWLVILLLGLVEELVDGLDLELGFFEGLHGGGVVDRVGDDVLQVGVDSALVDAHELGVEHVLALAQDFFGLTLAALLRLALSAFVFSQADHRVDAALLLEPHEFLGQLVHRLRDDACLQRLRDPVHNALLVILQQHVLGRVVTVALPLLRLAQLLDQVEPFLLALEHHVLRSTPTHQPLKKVNRLEPYVIFLHLFICCWQDGSLVLVLEHKGRCRLTDE